jgi:hypothetical protein
VYKKRIGVFKNWQFNQYKIEDDILKNYEKAWILEGDKKLTEGGLTMNEIDTEIEKWISGNSNFIESLQKEYKSLFITDYFLFSDFEKLYSRYPEERECYYCRITDKDIELLAGKGKLYTKRLRGYAMEIDRIEANKEYSPNNCVLACYWCNNAKTDEFSQDEFSRNIGPGIKSVCLFGKCIFLLKTVLRQIWGCFTLFEIKSPFSLTIQSLLYHTFAV